MSKPFIRRSQTLLAASALSLAMLLPALAGPVSDFEAQMRGAYADYRAALFQTNQKNPEGSAGALAAFETKWAKLDSALRQAPPAQYQGDAKLPATLDAIAALSGKARAEIGRGELPAAHETLEGIRDQLSDLRARNGITGFSDRMNAYHEAMEHVLLGDHGAFDRAVMTRLGEEAAVLDYLVSQIEKHPAPEAAEPSYAPMVAAVRASVTALQNAVRAGDVAATKAAIGGLKVPYSKLFLKFG
jgi:hypothetical protein